MNRWEGWTWRGGLMKPPKEPLNLDGLEAKARADLEREKLGPLRDLAAIRDRAVRLAEARPAGSARRSLDRMASIAGWVLRLWEGKIPEKLLSK